MSTRTRLIVTTAVLAFFSISCFAETSSTAKRNNALRAIAACLHRNQMSSRECKYLNQNIQTLVDVYRSGDKSVLPTLLHFSYLTEFFDEALLSDPDGFLMAMNRLPEHEQRQVAAGIAGGAFKPLPQKEFDAVRTLLTNISQTSSTKHVADLCLKAVETNNASLFVSYFPPQTFTSRAAAFQIFWYSRDLYSMEEKPLWPPSSSTEATFRFTYLGAFTGPMTVSLTLMSDGTGSLRMKALSVPHDALEINHSATVAQEQVEKFLGELKQADFWHMPAEEPARGVDGAEWILEGVQNGEYRVAVRWCPGTESDSPQTLAFADAARLLLDFAGRKLKGDC